MKTTKLAGATVPVIGQGTWRMGEDRARRKEEIAAIRHGVGLGMTLIDTAEMYGEGATESFLGEALAGLRDKVFLVSKAYPHNAGRRAVSAACEASLKRLRADRIDLYLLHWRGSIPLAETIRGMEDLIAAGKIGAWGVSNFDIDDIEDLRDAGGAACAANQILYNATRREAEFELLAARRNANATAIAYSPLEQGRLPRSGALANVAARRDATIAQIAIAWTLRQPNLIAIPKAGGARHVEDNRAAAEIVLTAQDLAEIDAQFPPPRRRAPLPML